MKIKISNFFFIVASFGLLFSLILSGCTQGERLNIKTSLESVESNTLTRIQDIPFLPKSKIEMPSFLN